MWKQNLLQKQAGSFIYAMNLNEIEYIGLVFREDLLEELSQKLYTHVSFFSHKKQNETQN